MGREMVSKAERCGVDTMTRGDERMMRPSSQQSPCSGCKTSIRSTLILTISMRRRERQGETSNPRKTKSFSGLAVFSTARCRLRQGKRARCQSSSYRSTSNSEAQPRGTFFCFCR
ncbi:hypothetical protein PHSY_003408 [Pseudozyma hubeiensis SY62]|uniref:Uncharacterized protein n=1 Tax=Pseudozyma hubeiensis (strain SY62) TaxID=1305764 RepID=R9P3C2_PSEHS|nr:hypothetical protein PHSY_003408 [Pseudozyma hubeiensis SY62]GAC95831.1 hypothetical protein PHSY_003408 [Pseudozyma hubeiensis SY62]